MPLALRECRPERLDNRAILSKEHRLGYSPEGALFCLVVIGVDFGSGNIRRGPQEPSDEVGVPLVPPISLLGKQIRLAASCGGNTHDPGYFPGTGGGCLWWMVAGHGRGSWGGVLTIERPIVAYGADYARNDEGRWMPMPATGGVRSWNMGGTCEALLIRERSRLRRASASALLWSSSA